MSNPFDDDIPQQQQHPITTSSSLLSTNPFDDREELYVQHHNDESRTKQQQPPLMFANDDDRGGAHNTTMNIISMNNNDNNNFMSVVTENDDEDYDEYDDDIANNDNNNNIVGGALGGSGGISNSQQPAEASWQYLGELPYRRVPIYSNVRWERSSPPSSKEESKQYYHQKYHQNFGLESFPLAALQQERHRSVLDQREIRALLKTTTITKVSGCPNGGPIAVVTVPVGTTGTGGGSSAWKSTELRILTNAGKPLATLSLPPPPATTTHAADLLLPTPVSYTPADILQIGFTTRTTLIVVLRNSLCLTYNLRGEQLIPPFYIMPSSTASSSSTADPNNNNNNTNTNVGGGGGSKGGVDLMLATIFDGGVAVLATNQNSAIVELLDEHDDPEYLQTADPTSRIVPSPSSTSGADSSPTTEEEDYTNQSTQARTRPKHHRHYALITRLPTATHAQLNNYHPHNNANNNNNNNNGRSYYRALAVLSRTRTTSRHPEVFLSTMDRSVVIVDVSNATIVTDVQCRERFASPITQMSFAPNGRFLACFTESAMLTVISTSFDHKVLDFDTSYGAAAPPLDMQWCGEDSVVLHWKNLGVLMVGPYGDWLRFPYEGIEHVHLIPEMDCCRVITDSSVEILQRVPPATAALLRIGSIETSAMLLDASDAFEAGLATSDENAQAIVKTGMLREAIETCTDAATKEFDILAQKRLLKAASYGMHFSYKTMDAEDTIVLGGPHGALPLTSIQDAPPEDNGVWPSSTTLQFVQAGRKLRILNALRNPNVGFLLTSAQFDAMTPTGVVARLIAMKRPALATSISKYMSLPRSVQLFSRASKAAALVEADKGRSDSEVAEAAIRIINEQPQNQDPKSTSALSAASINSNIMLRGGYATVALAATKAGRPGVANLLLMLETSVADKVPALISTGSFVDAMAVATTARDSDFIFSTLMEYERVCMMSMSAADATKAQANFLSAVVSKFTQESFHTLRKYLLSTSDAKSVTNLLLRAQKFADAGAAMATRALLLQQQDDDNTRERQTMLHESSRLFGLGKDNAFYKQCTDEYLELLKDQEVLRTKYGVYEVAPDGVSIADTIRSVLHYAAKNVREQHRLLSDADKLGKKFRITEKRLWYIKVKAFASSKQWSNLRILADSRTKSPIGYKPFALATIKGKQSKTEIIRYIERVTQPEERCDLYIEGMIWKNALEEATKLKDIQRILTIKRLCNNIHEIQVQTDQILGKLA